MSINLAVAHPNNPFRQPVFHPRSEWVEPGYPITGSSWLGFGAGPHKVNTQIEHYPGDRLPARWVSAAAADVIARLRQSNRASWTSRGYALYYNFDLPTDGSLWEIRGFSIRNAANADDDKTDGNENDWSYAVHCIFQKINASGDNVTEDPTWDQLETLRWLRWEAREYAIEATGDSRFQIGTMPHCDIKPTGCCGDKGIAAVRAGVIDIPDRNVVEIPETPPAEVHPPVIDPKPVPPIEVPPPSGDDDMSHVTEIVRCQGATFAVIDHGAGGKDWIAAGTAVNHVALNAAKAGVQGIYVGDPTTDGHAVIREVTASDEMAGLGPVRNCNVPSAAHGGQTLIQLGWDQYGYRPAS